MANPDKHVDELERSVGTLYENLLRERQRKQEEKRRRKAELSATDDTPDDAGTDEPSVLTKAEKKKRIEESWHELMTNLTGDDLELSKPKKGKRKKYRKWIGEEDDGTVLTKKPKKKKKQNYRKEFEQELSMLKQIVAEQNRFTGDLTKRFQVMVGPATKDAGPMSKTAVELASAVIASRSNSLAIIREIGGLKKTVAQLTQKEKELEAKGRVDVDERDLTLMGSSLAQDIFGSRTVPQSAEPMAGSSDQSAPAVPVTGREPVFEEFDPAAWSGSPAAAVDLHTKYENLPTETVVELSESDGSTRFKTIRTDTNEEIPDYPNPTFEVKQLDRENRMARDTFDSVYRLEVV